MMFQLFVLLLANNGQHPIIATFLSIAREHLGFDIVPFTTNCIPLNNATYAVPRPRYNIECLVVQDNLVAMLWS